MTKPVILLLVLSCLIMNFGYAKGNASGSDLIIVGGDSDFAPYEYLDDHNQPAGYNVDVIRAVAEVMGLRVRFQLDKWDKITSLLRDGKIDVIQGMNYSRGRASTYAFSTAYADAWCAVFVKHNSDIHTFKDLRNARVVIQKGDIAEEYVHGLRNIGLYDCVPTQTEAILALEQDKYDAAIINYMVGAHVLDKYKISDITHLPDKICYSKYGISALKENIDLINTFNTGVSIISHNGKLSALQKKWFGTYSYQRQRNTEFFKTVMIIISCILVLLGLGLIWLWSMKKQIKSKTRDLQQELEEKILLEEELLQEYKIFFDGPIVAYKLLYESNHLLYISDNVKQFGYTKSELEEPSFNVNSVIYPEDQERITLLNSQCVINKTEFDEKQYRIQAKNGDIHWIFDYSSYDYVSEGRTVVYGYLIDITIQKQLEAELKIAKEKAEYANQAKGFFLANMSHEIRTPLNGILGFVQVLIQSEVDEQQRDYLRLMLSSGKNIMMILNDILDFSKIESGKLDLIKTDFNPKYLIEEIVKNLIFNKENANIDIKYKIDGSVPSVVHGDMFRMKQIFNNLLQHSLKYTEKGWIEISADIYTKTDNEVRIIFSVCDTGMGIDPVKQQDIFDNFTQSDLNVTRKYGLTGLGLSIVKKLVEIMGGFIWVESEIGSGSSYYFILPFSMVTDANQVHLELEEQTKMPEQKLQPLNVLIVEDEPINQIVTKKQLERWDQNVTIANNGLEAVNCVKEREFDCILMDIQMPEMDGVTATKLIREIDNKRGKHTIIYAFTAAAMVGDRERFIEAGMDDYLSKPIDLNLLYDFLLRVKDTQHEYQ